MGRAGSRQVDPRIVELDVAPATPVDRGERTDERTFAVRGRATHSDARAYAVAVFVVAFVAAAIAKPWGGQDTQQAVAPQVATASIGMSDEPAPTPAVDDLATLRIECADPNGWRVYSHEIWTDEHVRTWYRLDPAQVAGGPLDPAIPVVEVGTGTTALGYCSPWSGTERPPADATVAAWRIVRAEDAAAPAGTRNADGAGATDETAAATDAARRADPLALTSIAPDRPTVLGALYAPVRDRFDPAITDTAGWAPGEVVFAIRAEHWQRWWAVVVAPPRTAAAGPTRSTTAADATPTP